MPLAEPGVHPSIRTWLPIRDYVYPKVLLASATRCEGRLCCKQIKPVNDRSWPAGSRNDRTRRPKLSFKIGILLLTRLDVPDKLRYRPLTVHREGQVWGVGKIRT